MVRGPTLAATAIILNFLGWRRRGELASLLLATAFFMFAIGRALRQAGRQETWVEALDWSAIGVAYAGLYFLFRQKRTNQPGELQ